MEASGASAAGGMRRDLSNHLASWYHTGRLSETPRCNQQGHWHSIPADTQAPSRPTKLAREHSNRSPDQTFPERQLPTAVSMSRSCIRRSRQHASMICLFDPVSHKRFIVSDVCCASATVVTFVTDQLTFGVCSFLSEIGLHSQQQVC
jgi:hypothetical protein